MRAPRPCGAVLAYDTSVKATLRTTLGWLAAVLINVGVVAFALGLLLPRVGGTAPVLVTGIALLIVGVAVGAAWMFVSRQPPR